MLSRLFQKNENIYIYSYFIFKFCCVIIAGYISYFLRFTNFDASSYYDFIIFITALINFIIELAFKKENFYSYSIRKFIKQEFLNFIYAIVLILILGAIIKYTEVFSRIWFGIFIILSILFFFINKIFFNFYHKKIITKSKYYIKNVMLVGSAKECVKFFRSFRNKRYHLKLNCIAYPSATEKKELSVPHIYLDDNLSFNIKYHKINQVWIIASNDYSRMPLIEKFSNTPVDIITIENTIGISDRFMEKIDNYSLYQTSFTPFYGETFFIKMIIDILFSFVALILLSPLFILVSLIILIEDGRPIIFSQQRHGWDGHPFNIYKFRTLKYERKSKFKQVQKNDMRYLKSGKWFRKLSIDELPQLINVLKGDMSLVGPRPHAIEHNNEFALKLRGFMQRHRCKPGITGLAQVKGYRGVTDTDEKMQKRYEEDLKYIENWSLLLDFKIILKTAFVFLLHNAD